MSVFADIWNAWLSKTAYQGPWSYIDFPSFVGYGPFAQQIINFLNITACQLETSPVPQCKGVQKVPDMTDDEVREWERASWIMSIDRDQKDTPMPCPEGWSCQNPCMYECYNGTTGWCRLDWVITYHGWNVLILMAYQTIVMRLDKLWPGHADELWPYFYYMYNTTYGYLRIESLIVQNPDMPQQCIDALKANYTDDIQKVYCLLNEPDLCNLQKLWTWELEAIAFVNPAQARALLEDTSSGVKFLTIAQTGAFQRLGNPTWTPKQREVAYDQLFYDPPDEGWDNTLMKGFWAFYLSVGWLKPNKDPSQPPTPVQDPTEKAGKDNPYNVPGYYGQIPYAPKPKLDHQRIGHSGDTKDPNAKKVCVPEAGFLETWVPIAAGVVGGAFTMMLMPGKISKLVGGTTIGTFGYFYISNAYGWDAFQAIQYGLQTSGDFAALVLSVGLPATGVTILYDLGIVPASMSSTAWEIGTATAGGAVGYAALFPILQPVLHVSGTFITILTLPIAALERLVQAFSSGCVEAMIDGGCLCEKANVKDALAQSILSDIYGVTSDQLTLRTACMRRQMMKGNWGPDPVHIGSCDPSTHTQTNVAACLDSQEYTEWNMDPQNALAYGMYELLLPCLDDSNPVFFPPRPEDKPCASLGPHYRMIDGKCEDYGVDEPLPSSGSKNECIIL